MKRFVVFIILLPVATSQIILSEIMYNPEEGGEWIELYTEQQINFSNYEIEDNYYRDEIVCCEKGCSYIIPENNYVVIGEMDEQQDLFDFCVDDNSIGNGLGNNEDNILIYSQNINLINFSYNQPTTKGYSISLINNTYLETKPTPKKENVFSPPKPEPILSQYIERGMTNQEYYLFKITNNYGTVNSTLYYNISKIKNKSILHSENFSQEIIFKNTKSAAENIFLDSGQYEICGKIKSNKLCYLINITDSSKIPCNISLWIQTEKNIYNQDEKIEYYIKLSNESFSYDIEYWIEDIFGKNIKSSHITHNTNKRRYTPKIKEKEKSMIISAMLNYISCNNSAKKISDELLVAVQGKETEITEEIIETKIKIDIKDNEYYFGETIYPKLSIAKGDTSKYVVKIYLLRDNIKSDPVSFYVYGKNKESEIKLPLYLTHPKEEEGKYYIIAEGLGLYEKTSIKIKNKNTEQDQEKIDLVYYSKNTTNKTLSIISIKNNDDKESNYEIWSYIYSGPKSYSGNRTLNKKKIKIDPQTSEAVYLENYLQELPSNNIKLKIKIKKENSNKIKEITKNITYIQTKKQTKNITNSSSLSKQELNQITGKTIYKSSSSKLSDYSVYFLISVVCLAVFALTRLKKI